MDLKTVQDFFGYPLVYTSQDKKKVNLTKDEKTGSVITLVALSILTGGIYLIGSGIARGVREAVQLKEKTVKEKNETDDKATAIAQPALRESLSSSQIEKPPTIQENMEQEEQTEAEFQELPNPVVENQQPTHEPEYPNKMDESITEAENKKEPTESMQDIQTKKNVEDSNLSSLVQEEIQDQDPSNQVVVPKPAMLDPNDVIKLKELVQPKGSDIQACTNCVKNLKKMTIEELSKQTPNDRNVLDKLGTYITFTSNKISHADAYASYMRQSEEIWRRIQKSEQDDLQDVITKSLKTILLDQTQNFAWSAKEFKNDKTINDILGDIKETNDNEKLYELLRKFDAEVISKLDKALGGK